MLHPVDAPNFFDKEKLLAAQIHFQGGYQYEKFALQNQG